MVIEYLLILPAILIAFTLAYQDLKTQQISILYLMGFGALSALNFTLKGPTLMDFLGLGIMFSFLVLVLLFERFKGKIFLGAGDKVLLICCTGWLNAKQVPYFLILAGILGVFTAGIFWIIRRRTLNDQNFQGRRFPFAPAILLALLISRFL